MGAYTQEGRPARVRVIGLGENLLLLQGLSGQEGISVPFSYVLEVWSDNKEINHEQLLKKPVLITVERQGGQRLIHGLINRFVQLDNRGDLTGYRAYVVPWLWFLSLWSNCKIFRNLSVPDIVEQVFQARGYGGQFRLALNASQYTKREFCVQYRETDLNFISRLLEEEGIFYYFEHARDKHTMVLCDETSTLSPCPGQPTASVSNDPEQEDVVKSLQLEDTVHVGAVLLRDYDYLHAHNLQEVRVPENGHGTGEVYEYPGSYIELGGRTDQQGARDDAPTLLNHYATRLLDEREAWSHVMRGESTCRSFQSGYGFDLSAHYRRDVNRKYRLLYVQHQLQVGDYLSGESKTFAYRNSFVAIRHDVRLRPPRTAPKPAMQGSQTAVVVGQQGEEMTTDSLGRVFVKFHWDRDAARNPDCSCPVRVSTTWAGKSWGFVQIPRIGEEVIVDFIEGDPDRPIITGRVYNSDHTPPYELPANQTQTGIKTRSSKNGGSDNFNEMRLEDKKGSEEIYVHAEKDLRIEAENDETRTIGHDRITTIENADTRTVNQGHDTETIKQGNQIVTIETGNQEVTLKQGNKTETIKQGNQTVSIEMGNQEVTLKQGNQTIVLSMGNQETKLDQGNVTTKAALGTIAFEAMQAIELKVGQNSIKIEQAGVTIKGLNVKVEGQVQAEIKSVMTTVKGDGMLTVKGGITMIN